MTYVDLDPALTYDSEAEGSAPEAFTHENLAEIAELYRERYSVMLYIAKGYRVNDPEGTVQTAFEKALKNWNKYEDQGQSRSAWLNKILVNTALDETRGSKLRPVDYLDEDLFEKETVASMDTEFENVEHADNLERIKNLLKQEEKPDSWYEMIDLRVQGYTVDEISKKLDIKLGTVKTGLFRAAKFLSSIDGLRASLYN